MSDSFLINYFSFGKDNQPYVNIQSGQTLEKLTVFDIDQPLNIDVSERHCTGWTDFANKLNLPCPDNRIVDRKYENCVQCRNKTGFNPAFYNSTTISDQQNAINQKPHFVYLAYFSPSVIKVGISQQSRGNRRLLEQGARMAMRLETFPNALVARQYEEKISKQCRLLENITQNKKILLLRDDFEPDIAKQTLESIKQTIECELAIKFLESEIVETNDHFFRKPIDTKNIVYIPDLKTITGEIVAAIGPIIITKYQTHTLAYNIKSFLGYRAYPSTEAPILDLPSEQMSLF